MSELTTSLDSQNSESVIFKTPTEFSMYIETYAINNEVSYLEAIMEYCEDHMLEPTDIATKITKSLKNKLEQDYVDLNYLPRQPTLDV